MPACEAGGADGGSERESGSVTPASPPHSLPARARLVAVSVGRAEAYAKAGRAGNATRARPRTPRHAARGAGGGLGCHNLLLVALSNETNHALTLCSAHLPARAPMRPPRRTRARASTLLLLAATATAAAPVQRDVGAWLQSARRPLAGRRPRTRHRATGGAVARVAVANEGRTVAISVTVAVSAAAVVRQDQVRRTF